MSKQHNHAPKAETSKPSSVMNRLSRALIAAATMPERAASDMTSPTGFNEVKPEDVLYKLRGRGGERSLGNQRPMYEMHLPSARPMMEHKHEDGTTSRLLAVAQVAETPFALTVHFDKNPVTGHDEPDEIMLTTVGIHAKNAQAVSAASWTVGELKSRPREHVIGRRDVMEMTGQDDTRVSHEHLSLIVRHDGRAIFTSLHENGAEIITSDDMAAQRQPGNTLDAMLRYMHENPETWIAGEL